MSTLHVVFEILDQETGKTIYVGKTSGNVSHKSLFEKIRREKRYYQDLRTMIEAYESQGKKLGVRFEYLKTKEEAYNYKKELCEAYGFGKNSGTFKLDDEPTKPQPEISKRPVKSFTDGIPQMAIPSQKIILPWQKTNTEAKSTEPLPEGAGKTESPYTKEGVKGNKGPDDSGLAGVQVETVKVDGPENGYKPQPLESAPTLVKVEEYRYKGYWIMGNYYATLGEASRMTGETYESLYMNVSNHVNGYEQALVPKNQG